MRVNKFDTKKLENKIIIDVQKKANEIVVKKVESIICPIHNKPASDIMVIGNKLEFNCCCDDLKNEVNKMITKP